MDNDGNDIEESNENDYTLNDIIDKKKIKIISIEGEDSGQLKICLNDELKFSKNIDQKKHLNKTRKILEKYIYQNISFFRPRWMWNWKAKRKWLFNPRYFK